MSSGDTRWMLAHGRSLSLDRPRLLGIVNVTPDSFSDGGLHADRDAAVAHAMTLVEDGADMLDIGGESTRPGAESVSVAVQIERVVPVIAELRRRGAETPISVDTTRATVARAAIDAGADVVNDISACTDDLEMPELIAKLGVGIILMHRLVSPRDDAYSNHYKHQPDYGDRGVVDVVREYLRERAHAMMQVGVARERIVLDPGLGFGKSVEQNFELAAHMSAIAELGFPALSAASRKSFIGVIAGETQPQQRVAGTIALSVAHALAGVRLFRVHDVKEHAQALRVAWALSR